MLVSSGSAVDTRDDFSGALNCANFLGKIFVEGGRKSWRSTSLKGAFSSDTRYFKELVPFSVTMYFMALPEKIGLVLVQFPNYLYLVELSYFDTNTSQL